MKKKKLNILLIFILTIITLTGCKSEELVKKEKFIEEFANENSLEISEKYIEDKYDINAKMVDYHLETSYNMFYSYYTGTVACEMEYKNNTFFVLYDANDIDYISDNYQENIIKKQIKKYLNFTDTETISISYSETNDGCNSVYIDSLDIDNCITSKYINDIERLLNQFDNLSIYVTIDSEESVQEFKIKEKLKDLEHFYVSIENIDSNNQHSSSDYFKYKETISFRKNRNNEIEIDYVQFDKIEPIEGYVFTYNCLSDFSDLIKILPSDNIDIEGYEVISPIFYMKGETVISGLLLSEVKVENYGHDYYIMKYSEDVNDYKIINCKEYNSLYKDTNVVFLKKITE